MTNNRLISIAPMMDWTDRHARYFLRLIAPDVWLYTEMVTVNALIYGDAEKHLAFHPAEHPIALQLGGSEPTLLAKAAQLGTDFGYDEINLNVGCPSDRVQAGRFGACLMHEPTLVAECVAAMREVTTLPVTVKCRIGVDQRDSYAELVDFIREVAASGCQIFIIHARKAWLKGLSPKENREIPPLQYETVQQLKADFPHLIIIVNGGIRTLASIREHLSWADGVMIGREAYQNPYFLAEIQQQFFGGAVSDNRQEIMQQFIPYITEELAKGVKLSQITRHILGLYHGQKGARAWRRHLSSEAPKAGNDIAPLLQAMQMVE